MHRSLYKGIAYLAIAASAIAAPLKSNPCYIQITSPPTQIQECERLFILNTNNNDTIAKITGFSKSGNVYTRYENGAKERYADCNKTVIEALKGLLKNYAMTTYVVIYPKLDRIIKNMENGMDLREATMNANKEMTPQAELTQINPDYFMEKERERILTSKRSETSTISEPTTQEKPQTTTNKTLDGFFSTYNTKKEEPAKQPQTTTTTNQNTTLEGFFSKYTKTKEPAEQPQTTTTTNQNTTLEGFFSKYKKPEQKDSTKSH